MLIYVTMLLHFFSNLWRDFLLCICGGIDAKNVIVHMVTMNQELHHEQIVVFNMIDPKIFARINFCKIAAFNLNACTCM